MVKRSITKALIGINAILFLYLIAYFYFAGVVCICVKNEGEASVDAEVDINGNIIKYGVIEPNEEECNAIRIRRDGGIIYRTKNVTKPIMYVHKHMSGDIRIKDDGEVAMLVESEDEPSPTGRYGWRSCWCW